MRIQDIGYRVYGELVACFPDEKVGLAYWSPENCVEDGDPVTDAEFIIDFRDKRLSVRFTKVKYITSTTIENAENPFDVDAHVAWLTQN